MDSGPYSSGIHQSECYKDVKSVQSLPVMSASFASQARCGNYKTVIQKIAGKIGLSFLAKLANSPRFLPGSVIEDKLILNQYVENELVSHISDLWIGY